MEKKVKLTVLKRECYSDFIKEYAADPSFPQCPKFEDGQVFILDATNMPEGFCSWAWADLHRDIVSVFRGASFPWINRKNAIISCCTDGLRPVVFKIEAIED